MSSLEWLLVFAQSLLFVAVAPLYAGSIKRVKAVLQNRRPPVFVQPYRNLRKLFAKEIVLAHTASPIFRIAPYVVFGTAVLAASIIPLVALNSPAMTIADAIVLVGILALGRFLLALAGMDVGTAFGGMGASREMMVASLAEPTMLMVIFTLAMVAASTNLSTIIAHTLNSPFALHPSLLFALIALVLVGIAETGRLPVDNPATHLELTMIHEAMILEYSGPYLALLELAAQIKLMIYSVLIINLFFPWGIAAVPTFGTLAVAAGALVLKLAVLGVLLALAETALAKLRVFRAPLFLAVAFAVAFVGLLSFVILEAG